MHAKLDRTARTGFARFVLSGLAAVLLTSATSFSAAPSFAASLITADAPPPGAIELSVDGVNWSNPLTTSPFDESLIWVPGDSLVGSVWVRTTCEAASGVATWQLEPDSPPVWADDLLVRSRVGDSSEWGEQTVFADCQAVTEFTVSAGTPVRLDLEIQFPYGDATSVSVNDTQARLVEIENAAITLTCDGATTVRPAIRQCEPPEVIPTPGPGNGDSGGDNTGDGSDNNGSGTNGSSGGDGSSGSGNANSGSSYPSNSDSGSAPQSVSGILAYRNTTNMSRTGVEILRTTVAVAALVGTGLWLLLKAKPKRARFRHD